MIETVGTTVEQWAKRHPSAVLYDSATETLLDVASGKSLRLPSGEVAACEEKTHPETGSSYLVFLLTSGLQLVLVDPGGVAFAPSEGNTGSLSGRPEVVCLRDFGVLMQRVDHHVQGHPDEPGPRECLDAVMLCIAILDGARGVGFDVGDLEQKLERLVRELESRGVVPD